MGLFMGPTENKISLPFSSHHFKFFTPSLPFPYYIPLLLFFFLSSPSSSSPHRKCKESWRPPMALEAHGALLVEALRAGGSARRERARCGGAGGKDGVVVAPTTTTTDLTMTMTARRCPNSDNDAAGVDARGSGGGFAPVSSGVGSAMRASSGAVKGVETTAHF